ncbi:MAG TPA: WYL domain-containing protein, partial [Gemmatimonadaceae bacterium]
IVEGGRRIAQAGDPALAEDARNGLRKLAFDLPLGASDAPPHAVLVPPIPRPDPHVLGVLSDALFRRKRASFMYHGMGDEHGAQRAAEPYGLFFQSGHWYLAARDIDKHALRNFRVSRMTDAAVNKLSPGTPDYEIPAGFSLRAHARSRHAWEIGDGDSYEATVEFTGETGAAIAAAALGRQDPASPALRHFHVRRTDSFARWLLTFAGEARPVTPEALVREYDTIVGDTRALYAAGAAR